MNIIKIGRTHMQDATLRLTLGQEFSGYVIAAWVSGEMRSSLSAVPQVKWDSLHRAAPLLAQASMRQKIGFAE